jgi:hypothetical protein
MPVSDRPAFVPPDATLEELQKAVKALRLAVEYATVGLRGMPRDVVAWKQTATSLEQYVLSHTS